MSHDPQNLSRRDLMRIGATGVAAASIASLPVTAAEKAASDKLPKRRGSSPDRVGKNRV
jgi:hypothetical protein